MRIEKTGSSSGVSKLKKAKKSGSSSDFASHLEGESEDTSATGSVGAPVSLNPLFSLQEVGDDGEKLAAREQGETILQELEDLRLSLLLGEIPRSKLERLSHLIHQRKKTFTDPRLREILLEIELRARVELAKYQMTSG